MKLNKFLELFKGLDPDTEIEVPELRISGHHWEKIGKLELSLELFKIKDRQYKEKIVRQNSLFLVLIIILTIICGIQLLLRKFGM